MFSLKNKSEKCSYKPLECNVAHPAAPTWIETLNATMTGFSPDSAGDIWWSYQSPSFIVPSILVMFLGRATQAKIRFLVFVVSSDGLCRKTLSGRRLQVHPRAHVVVTEEAWVGWQSVVGKYGIVVWGARAGGVFTRWWILFERGG